MITYFQNGLMENLPYIIDETSKYEQFFIQDLGIELGRYYYPNDSVKYRLDDELVCLYDVFRDIVFPNTEEYYSLLETMPLWVLKAGQDSDFRISVDQYNRLISEWSSEILFKMLYIVDCQYYVGTIQNLLSGMDDIFINFYKKISSINEPTPTHSDTVMIMMCSEATSVTSLLESYFIKAYSILDMFSKIAYEIEHTQTNFTKYKKMPSADILWGDVKRLSVNGLSGTVFEKDEIVKQIESLRNEVVHNGAWELNPKVFFQFEKSKCIKKFVLFPDMNQGRLSSSKNRKHFFSDCRVVNDIFPELHIHYMNLIINTACQLNSIAHEKI